MRYKNNKNLHFLSLGEAERIIHPTSKERWLSDLGDRKQGL
jgi:hypothetical protein